MREESTERRSQQVRGSSQRSKKRNIDAARYDKINSKMDAERGDGIKE